MLWQSAAEALSDGPRIDELREAIKANRVCFPVPVMVFPTQFRPDIQWRLVELYFIRGWSSKQLAERYGVTARRIQQSLQHWADRAMARGYLQEIPAETSMSAPPAGAWETVAATPEVLQFPVIPAPIAPDFAASPVS